MANALFELVGHRAGFRCEYCHMLKELDPLPFHVDHIIAQQHRGETIESNLALACYDWK